MRLGEHLLLEHRQLTQKVVIEPLTPEEIQELHEEHHYFGIDNG
jgi:hypothetical protein